MPAVLVLDGRYALALQRRGEDSRRPAGQRRGVRVRLVDRLDVVAVDLDRVPPERTRALGEDARVPPDHRLSALPEPVHVDDRREVVEAVVRGVLERLPHRALGQLRVAAQHPDPVREPVEVPAGDRHADADRQPLAERPGGNVDPGEDRRRVALERAAERPVAVEVLLGDHARSAEDPVEERRCVALREDETVVRRGLRIRPVVAEVAVHEHGHEVGGRHAGGRVAGARQWRSGGSNRPAVAARARASAQSWPRV